MQRPSPSGAGLPPTPADTAASALQGAGELPALQQPWRRNITFKAMGWGLKESCDSLQLLPGDRFDIAYSLKLNDHPEFGGLELSLQDVKRSE